MVIGVVEVEAEEEVVVVHSEEVVEGEIEVVEGEEVEVVEGVDAEAEAVQEEEVNLLLLSLIDTKEFSLHEEKKTH